MNCFEIQFDNLYIYDSVFIGFGPSNISLCIAERELAASLNYIVLEKNEAFSWHDSMLFDDATMQVSFLKDLANFRNPCSKFTFTNYLHSKGRLAEFTNLGTFYPTRREYRDYFKWCSEFFEDRVSYGTEVKEISVYSRDSDSRPLYKVSALVRGKFTEFLCRSIVFAGGLNPHFPTNVEESSKGFP